MAQTNQKSILVTATLLLSGIAVATLGGLLIGGGAGLPLIVGLSGLIVLPTVFFAAQNLIDSSGWLLIIGWLVMLVTHLSETILPVPVGYLHEVVLFGLSAVIAQRVWLQSRSDPALRVLMALWLIYFGIGILSSILGRSKALPALWQFQYNLKLPLMFSIGMLVEWNTSTANWMRRIIRWSFLALAASVGLEVFSPSIHAAVFGPSLSIHANNLLGHGTGFRGPFPHPGHLALVSAFLAIAALAQTISGNGRQWIVGVLAYTTLLLLAGQRQEFLAFVLSAAFIFALYFRRYWYLSVTGVVAIFFCFWIVVEFLSYIPMRQTLEQWGFLASTRPYSERAVLTFHGLSIGGDYFPLGSGLGTYGGVGAMKFDQSLFLDEGFMHYWWFRKGQFLVDTFWPNVVAESGYIGSASLLAFFALLWVGLITRTLKSVNTDVYVVCLTALASLTLLLANSPSSGALTDPRSSFALWVIIGTAWRASCRIRQSSLSSTSRLIGELQRPASALRPSMSGR